MAVKDEFWVRFWGVRGTVPCPGPDTLRYGGNTACVEVMCGGSAADPRCRHRPARARRQPERPARPEGAYLPDPHPHRPHQRLPVLPPGLQPGEPLRALGRPSRRPDRRAAGDVLADLMQRADLPGAARHHARLHRVPRLRRRRGDRGGAGRGAAHRRRSTTPTAPPAIGSSTPAGRSATSPTPSTARASSTATILELIRGSQIVIYDATYTEAEYPSFRGWGHSTWNEGVRLCKAAGVRAPDRLPPRPRPRRRRPRPDRSAAPPRLARLAGGQGGHGPPSLSCVTRRVEGCPERHGGTASAAGAGACSWASRRCSAAGRAASSSPIAMPTDVRALRLPGARRRCSRPCWPAFERVLAEIDGAGAGAPAASAGRRRRRASTRTGSRRSTPRRPTRWSRSRRPRRIVEVGSGHSTRFLARAIADRALATTLALHRPGAARAPARPAGALAGDHAAARRPQSCFAGLAAGDLLFIDSSHILMPGSDVDWLLNRILPALAAGRPGPRPRRLPARPLSRRAGPGAATTSSRRWPRSSRAAATRVRFASHYVATRRRERLAAGVLARLPHGLDGLASSLWLEKRGLRGFRRRAAGCARSPRRRRGGRGCGASPRAAAPR